MMSLVLFILFGINSGLGLWAHFKLQESLSRNIRVAKEKHHPLGSSDEIFKNY